MEQTNILVISGTTRPNNNTQHCANIVLKVGKNLKNSQVKLININDLKLLDDGSSKDKKYTELTSWADAFFIVTPEYNHSIPGGLKRVLDSESTNYVNKAAAIAGVSAGPFGGARAIQNLLPVLRELGLYTISSDIYFPNVNSFLNSKDSTIIRKQEERILTAFNNLTFLAKCLKWGKQNL